MNYELLESAAALRHLTILGGFHPTPSDDVPEGFQTLLLLGPDEAAGFWAHVTGGPEFADGAPDPVDRWSRRVIGYWADEIGALALYPFGGPPYQPFQRWAVRTQRIHTSPIMLLVHDTAGLMVSFRGALALRGRIDLPPAPSSPCISCKDKPCLTACPVNAFADGGYDVPACKSYLGTVPGQDCMMNGCAARRACPVSQHFGRVPTQSAYHMQMFRG